MEFANLIEIGVVALYLSGAALYPVAMLKRKPALMRLAGLTAGGGFALHTLCIGLMFASTKQMTFTQGGLYFSLMAWMLLLVFFVTSWRKKLEFMGLAASPLALLLYLSSIALPDSVVKMPETFSGLFFTLHIGSLFVSLSLLAMAFAAGALFLNIEKKIKTKEKIEGFHKDLPSLNTFDLANKWAVNWGFPLYSLGLLAGFVWGRFTWGKLLTWDPKEIVSLLIWTLYAYLFHQRLARGWRGGKAAKLAMLVFVFSIASLVGVNFLTQSHHNF
ncbi:MAG: cytochrome c biogenesis protein [Proteobacteria bacterium]|nr:cytochrome c biogenesis protein [Pseudomonadota bacterium]